MYTNTTSDPSVAAADRSWLETLTAPALRDHILKRATLHLENIPSNACITVNGRSYPSSTPAIHGLPFSAVHLVTLSTNSPTEPLTLFLTFPPNSSCVLRYHDSDCSLSVRGCSRAAAAATAASLVCAAPKKNPAEALCVQAVPAERAWRGLVGDVNGRVLAAASVVCNIAPPPGDGPLCRFVPLPRHTFARNLSASELTALHLDRTAFVRSLITRRYLGDENQLVGELQLAYICFALGGDVGALEHWVRLLREVCTADGLEDAYKGLVGKLARLLNAQFSMLRDEAATVAFGKELRRCLACFISANWRNADVLDFAKTLNGIMGWALNGSEDDGDDSDGPVIVGEDELN